MAEIVRILLKAHDVVHVHELKGWKGTKDIELYARAKAEGYHVVITNDTKQLSRPLEVAAIARSGLHRIEYRQNNKHGGLVGLGTAIATVCAALPHAVSELGAADGQRHWSAVRMSSRLVLRDPLIQTAHQQLGGPIVLVWDNLNTHRAASSRSRPRPRRRARRRAPPRSFHLGPGLLHPAGDRRLVALHCPAGRHLAAPAVPLEQRGYTLHGVALVEPAPDEVLIRDRVQVWSGQPCVPALGAAAAALRA
jgi:hypothetical protein